MKYLLVNFLLLVFALACFPAYGQSYNTTAGLRMGSDWGFSVRQRVLKKASAEVIVQSNLFREETMVTGLFISHQPLITRRVNFFLGGGMHKGWLDEYDVTDTPIEDPFGLTAVLGAEMTFARIHLSYDFKPALNLQGGTKTIYPQSGISIRYVMWKKEKYPWEYSAKQRQRKKRKKQKQKERAKRKKERQKAKA